MDSLKIPLNPVQCVAHVAKHPRDRTSGNGLKRKKGGIKWDNRKKLIPMKVYRLCRNSVAA